MSDASIFLALQSLLRQERPDDSGAGKPKIDVLGGRKNRSGKLPRSARARAKYAFKTPRFLSGKRINTIVKASFVANNRDARRHVVQYLDYIQNRERGQLEPEPRKFYDHALKEVSRDEVVKDMVQNRDGQHSMFKIILSPGDNSQATKEECCAIVNKWLADIELDVPWYFTEHRNTDHHHFHIVMRGQDSDGQGYVMTRDQLDVLKSVANERQYRVQERDMDYEKQIEKELGLDYEQALRAYERHVHDTNVKEITGHDPRQTDLIARSLIGEADKEAGGDLTRGFDVDLFQRDLEKQIFSEQKQFEQIVTEAARSVLLNQTFNPSDFRQEIQKDYWQDKTNEELLTGKRQELSAEESRALEDFQKIHPECARENMLHIASNRLAEQFPFLRASYKEEYADYYLERLEQKLKESPELADRYKIDGADPASTRDVVLTKFLEEHAQISPEVLLQTFRQDKDADLKGDTRQENTDHGKQSQTKTQSEVDYRSKENDTGLIENQNKESDKHQEIWAVRYKHDPAEILVAQMNAIKEHYPELMYEFREALRDRAPIFDEFPEFLPGKESDRASQLQKLRAADRQQDKASPTEEKQSSHSDRKEIEPSKDKRGLGERDQSEKDQSESNKSKDDDRADRNSQSSPQRSDCDKSEDSQQAQTRNDGSELPNHTNNSTRAVRDTLYELSCGSSRKLTRDEVDNLDPATIRWMMREAEDEPEHDAQKEFITSLMFKPLDEHDEREDDSDRLFSQGESK